MKKDKPDTRTNDGPGEAEPEKVTLLKEEYDALQAGAKKAGEYWDQILRMKADFENTKKRMEKNQQELIKYANESLILEILQVSDDLERAIVSFEKDHDPAQIQKGVEMAVGKFHKILDSNGVQPIEAVGRHFDPHLHEAVGEVATDDVEEGVVVEEFQRGYLLRERLARPSRVKVSKKKSENGS